jgi:hemoglobin/transferrin/lactoferrin receptor protein
VRLAWAPPAGRFWGALELNATGEQTRLSSLDLEDRRVGAARSRSSIERFFDNGATARGLVGPGADGQLGTDDDVLLATGETLEALLDRVLGPGVDRAPLRESVPGYATLDLKLGARLGRHHRVLLELVNLTDASYRGMSWGLPGPGRGIRLRWSASF